MKIFSFVALMVFSWVSWASDEDLRKQIFESFVSCDQATFMDSQYVVSSAPQGAQWIVRVVDIHQPQNVVSIPFTSRIADVKIRNRILYVLTGTSLVGWDLGQQKKLFAYPSHPDLNPSMTWRQMASGFVLKGNRAVISHSVLGVSVLDLTSGQFLKVLRMPTVSSAQDIDLLNDSTAILAIDNDNEGAFRGLYLMDLSSMSFGRQIAIDNAFPSAVRVLDNNRLMVIYFNAVWKFDLAQAVQSSTAQPSRRAWKFPDLLNVDMIGKVAFDSKNIYACFNVLDPVTGARKPTPLAKDLAILKLL